MIRTIKRTDRDNMVMISGLGEVEVTFTIVSELIVKHPTVILNYVEVR